MPSPLTCPPKMKDTLKSSPACLSASASRSYTWRTAEPSTRAASNMLFAFQMVMGSPCVPSSRVSRSSSIWRISRTDCEMLRLPDDSSTMTRSPGCS